MSTDFATLPDMSTGCLNRLCLLLALTLGVNTVVALGNAQTSPPAESPPALEREVGPFPLCDPDSVDATFTFGNRPAGEQTVSLHFQNKSNAACRLHGQAGHSFAVDGHSMHVPNCWLCDPNNIPSPAPEGQSGNQVLLAPGERSA